MHSFSILEHKEATCILLSIKERNWLKDPYQQRHELTAEIIDF